MRESLSRRDQSEALSRHQRFVVRVEAAGDAFAGVPTFFRVGCRQAKNQTVPGGYSTPGYHLAIHIERLDPNGLELDEWGERVEALREFVMQRDDEAVLKWLVEHYPHCMALVPRRRRQVFLQGVYQAADEDRL